MFDLDDTLYSERDFVRSGYRAVSNAIERATGESVLERLNALDERHQPDPFGDVLRHYRIAMSKQELVDVYRDHQPDLALTAAVRNLLVDLRSAGRVLGLLTDGRSRTQRNKIRALGLEEWIDEIVISEEFGSAKPAERTYRHFERCFGGRPCVYVGDNLAKDFLAPNRLGWQTVCVLDQGLHIHPQVSAQVAADAQPQFWIERLA